MFNVVRTVYGFEVYIAGTKTDRICTCDDMQKAERMIVWLSALNDLKPLDTVTAEHKAAQIQVLPRVVKPETEE